MGTVGAIIVSVVAVHLAGAQVTARTIATVSRADVEEALAGEGRSEPSTEPVLDASMVAAEGEDAVAGAEGSIAGSDEGAPSAGGQEPADDRRSSGAGSGTRAAQASDDHGTTAGSGDSVESGRTASTEASGSESRSDGGTGGEGVKPSGTEDEGGEPSATTTVAATATYTTSSPGGSVVVRCSGAQVALVSSSPKAGYRAEVSDAGPQSVEVHFAGDQADYEIKARCSAGKVQWS